MRMLQGDWWDTVRVAAEVFKACIRGQCSVIVAHHLLVLQSLRPIRGQGRCCSVR